eukprot:TRINITY_DN56778_c0_g1_i2.p1 TRINITY_DN56778_c0_g1~~TRINITY_DN56778_c0_g1_i2.p1  ORF type:complete len:473 (+),score=21.65 TRINITY_DN56778_c0_g1_i2:78-1496(+)
MDAPTNRCSRDDLENVLLSWLQESMMHPTESSEVKDCLNRIRNILGSVVEQPVVWQVAAFGSSVNGFGSKGGDIDVVAFEDSSRCTSSSDSRSVLRALEAAFRQQRDFNVKEAVLSSRVRVPILKLRFAGTHDVDLSVNNVSPLPNTRLLRSYVALDTRVAQLGVLVKIWAKRLGCSGASKGHLSPYALILMAIYFMQVTDTKLPCLQRVGNTPFNEDESASQLADIHKENGYAIQSPISELFYNFISFYSTDFRWGSEVVSVRLGRREVSTCSEFAQLSKVREQRIHIEDPFIRTRNLNDVLWGNGPNALWECFTLTHAALQESRHTDFMKVVEAGLRKRFSRASYYPAWTSAHSGKGGGGYNGRGHTLPRTRISDRFYEGQILEWKGKYGWIRANEAIKHEDAHRHGGRVFLSVSDVLNGAATSVRAGDSCRFLIFSDEGGLGAEQCTIGARGPNVVGLELSKVDGESRS